MSQDEKKGKIFYKPLIHTHIGDGQPLLSFAFHKGIKDLNARRWKPCSLVNRYTGVCDNPNNFTERAGLQPYPCSSSGIPKLFINKMNFPNVFASQTTGTNLLQTSCLKQFSYHCSLRICPFVTKIGHLPQNSTFCF